ncbi:Peptidoglycan-associated lipoprotein [Castellaniella defragrans]
MKRASAAELQPAQAVVQRMQALQLELQRARQHLRRERRVSGIAVDRWGLKQTASQPQDEDWLITYLDMVTLLMVAMIVMLAFAAPISKQFKSTRAAVDTARVSPDAPPARLPALLPAGRPPVPLAAEIASSPSAAPANTPEASLPHAPSPSPAAEPPPAPVTLLSGAEGDVRSLVADQARLAAIRSGATGPAPMQEVLAQASAPRLSEPALAQETAPGSPSPAQMPETAQPSPAPEPAMGNEDPARSDSAAPQPVTSAQNAPSEGQAMADSLRLRELGKDVEVIVNKRSVSFRVNSEILFGTGQADLSKEGLTVLRRMARILVNAGYDITVEGHTDSVRVRSSAPYPSNWELSSARAGSVVRYLQTNGIPKSHLKAVGFADSRPIADNHTPDGRASNRRVELVISKHRDE